MYDIALAIVFLVALLLSYLLRRTLRKLDALGISEKHPSCGRCRYSMRGWNSPTCPECGRDVRQVGVITGSRWTRPLARGLVLCLAILASVACIRAAGDSRPVEFAEVECWWQSNTVGALRASLEWSEHRDPKGKPTDGTAHLSIWRTADGSDTILHERVVPWPNSSLEPTSDTIAATIREVAGDACDETAVKLHADEMAAALATALSSARAGTAPPAMAMTAWQQRWARSWIVPHASVMLTIAWMAPLAIILVGFGAVQMRHRPWRRAVRNGEVPGPAD